jgi:hypothetical protein
MQSLICGLAFTLLLPTISAAQKIRGVVVEDSTGLPIADVKIELLTADTSVLVMSLSRATGWFELLPQSQGQFLLRASHPAYRGISTLAVDFRAAEIITVVLRLSGGPIPLAPVIARASAVDRASGFRQRMKAGAYGRFITRADIDKSGSYNLSHVLRFTPEVRIERVRDGPFTNEGVFMRSFGDLCAPAVYLDGVPVAIGRVFDINDLLSPESVEGIEVYRSMLSAPMELRLPAFTPSDMTCGVIAVWSRSVPGGGVPLKGLLLSGFLIGTTMLMKQLLR